MKGFTAINASSRKTGSPIHTPYPAECFGTQSALDNQGLNHIIDLTTPSPPLLLRTSELKYSPISKPFEDTRTMSPTPNNPKDTVKTRIPLPHSFSQDVANPDHHKIFGKYFSTFYKIPTRSEFWATVMQAPADINTTSKKPPQRKLVTLIQDSENSVPPQTHARKDFWTIVMQTSENEPSSEKFLRDNSSGTTVRNLSSISLKKRPRKELLVAAVQKSAISTSSRKRPRIDPWVVCLE
ncbi:hypothetical protein BHYA_0236g00100 [Botrytis hyacinthi]|uniref:Uncharacterized protein n=1 Tax=Botrytis hyacinthi TaxID=278943 RepID=A0A4Z1G9V8_9HELO|nr:hypothetical protein BHYA_0236g00100 [Botrytis hyacinthi]